MQIDAHLFIGCLWRKIEILASSLGLMCTHNRHTHSLVTDEEVRTLIVGFKFFQLTSKAALHW